MPDVLPPDSVGLVTPRTQHFATPLALESGALLPEYDIVYETYGKLNAAHSNAVLICHALSSDHHAAGYHTSTDRKPGWWEVCIGPGKVIDTNRFFVVCMNNLGGCRGTSGPKSTNPRTGKPYGLDFPVLTLSDWSKAQMQLTEFLGIEQWAAVIGGSLGGMHALQWAIQYPDNLRHCCVLAATPKLTAQNIAFNEVARQAILNDPDFDGGDYYNNETKPLQGLRLARMLAHITYLSEAGMQSKFGRERKIEKNTFAFDQAEFQVESYLQHQGDNFARQFDANTYLLMTKALDYFDPARDLGNGSLTRALAHITAKFLVVSFTTDWRFSSARSQELVAALEANNRSVVYYDIETPNGHDAFLMNIPEYLEVFREYMNGVYEEA